MIRFITRQSKKILIACLGGLVLLAGLIMIPYPGPGWLVLFMGLAILSTEFAWAKGLLGFARQKYDAWKAWLANQTVLVQLLFLMLTGLIVVLTIWIFNGYGFFLDLLRLDVPWMRSPFFR